METFCQVYLLHLNRKQFLLRNVMTLLELAWLADLCGEVPP